MHILVNQIRVDADQVASVIQTMISTKAIRCFYPRHEGPGTRITFTDGGGFAVTEDFQTLRSQVVDIPLVDLTQTRRLTSEPGEDDAEDFGQDVTEPLALNADAIRCFYPRRPDLGVGTRITFTDGGGFVVDQDANAVAAAVGIPGTSIALPAPGQGQEEAPTLN